MDSFCRYEPYVMRMPAPSESEKNVKPMAFRMALGVTVLQSKAKRYFTPPQAPSSMRQRMMIATMSTKSVGIRYFERRSMPCCTPSATVPQVIARKTKCQPTLR